MYGLFAVDLIAGAAPVIPVSAEVRPFYDLSGDDDLKLIARQRRHVLGMYLEAAIVRHAALRWDPLAKLGILRSIGQRLRSGQAGQQAQKTAVKTAATASALPLIMRRPALARGLSWRLLWQPPLQIP